MTPEQDRLLDQILMLRMGNAGNDLAHLFIEDVARSPLRSAEEALWYGGGNSHNERRVFIPPKEADRVIMFSDNSGVYVHKDGFCTPMGKDISHEVVRWTEIRR